jgi:hypothetical protein
MVYLLKNKGKFRVYFDINAKETTLELTYNVAQYESQILIEVFILYRTLES